VKLVRVVGVSLGLALQVGLAVVQAQPGPSSAPKPQDVPQDPAATVPEVVYRSAFGGTVRGIEESRVDWRTANDQVGRFVRGHLDILKSEESPSAAPPTSSQPAAPAAGHRH
jgi:hypothetical protein